MSATVGFSAIVQNSGPTGMPTSNNVVITSGQFTSGIRNFYTPAPYFNDGNFNEVTGVYTVSITGTHLATTSINVTDVLPSANFGTIMQLNLQLLVNGNVVAQDPKLIKTGTGIEESFDITVPLNLNAGDTVSLRFARLTDDFNLTIILSLEYGSSNFSVVLLNPLPSVSGIPISNTKLGVSTANRLQGSASQVINRELFNRQARITLPGASKRL